MVASQVPLSSVFFLATVSTSCLSLQQLVLNTMHLLCSLILCLTDSCPLTCGPHKSRKETVLHSTCLRRDVSFLLGPRLWVCWCVSLFTLGKTQLPIWNWYGLTSLIKRIGKMSGHQKALMCRHFVEHKRIWNIWIKFTLKYTHSSLKTAWDKSHFGFLQPLCFPRSRPVFHLGTWCEWPKTIPRWTCNYPS